MKTLKTMIVGVFLGAGISNCDPDTVNNYYGSGKAPSGADGNYTCIDAMVNQTECVRIIKPVSDDYDFLPKIKEQCPKLKLPQDCIDCVATAPCDVDAKRPPLNFCGPNGPCYAVDNNKK